MLLEQVKQAFNFAKPLVRRPFLPGKDSTPIQHSTLHWSNAFAATVVGIAAMIVLQTKGMTLLSQLQVFAKCRVEATIALRVYYQRTVLWYLRN